MGRLSTPVLMNANSAMRRSRDIVNMVYSRINIMFNECIAVQFHFNALQEFQACEFLARITCSIQ